MARVFDASWKRPTPGQLQPGDGIILYASRTLSKCPTIAECTAYRAAGVEVGFVFEDSAARAAAAGYAEGKSDGALSLDMWKARGHAEGKPGYYACDTSEPLNTGYARGFADGLAGYYEARCYAGDRNLARAATVGQHKGWQAGAASWSDYWDFGASHGAYADASLYQVAGTSPIPGTDLNVVNLPDWNGPTLEVGMSAEDVKAINDHTDMMLQKYLWPALTQGDNSAFSNGISLPDLAARLAALQSAVAQLGAGGTIDYGKVEQAAEAALAKLRVVVTP